MDNVTHALAGALAAEAALAAHGRLHGPSPARAARLAYATSIGANSVPDADIVYVAITEGKLGYLLHHRGHTHTVLVGVILGVAVALALLGIARWRRWTVTPSERTTLIALGAVGPLLHLVMDSWNNYGVHPFWPIHSGWFYGDTIFIVEPLFWITAIPILIVMRRSRGWRVLLSLLLAFIVVLPWFVPEIVPLGVRLVLLAVTALFAAAAWRAPETWRLPVAIGAWAAVFGAFAAGSWRAERLVRDELAARSPWIEVRDVSLSPMPADPLCWMAIIAGESRAGGSHDLELRYAVVSSAGRAASCPDPLPDVTTAPLDRDLASAAPAIRHVAAFRAPLSELRALAKRCDVGAALRFMRMPYWTDRDGKLVVGDARYDRDEALDFAEVELPPRDAESVVCPRFVPGWTPPRADILTGSD